MTGAGTDRRAPARTRRLVAAAALNGALVVAEVVAGVDAHSSALLSDAGHNLSDVAAIGLSLAAVRWALRPRSELRTYGNHRGTILAALANATVLVVVTFVIVAIAVDRLVHPVAVHGGLVSEVAAASLVVNVAAALAVREPGRDLNLRSIALHMTADALSAVAVLVAGIVVVLAGPRGDLADPAASLAVALLVLVQAVRVVRESTGVLLESTPSDVDLAALRTALTSVEGVSEVHDLHVWSLSSDYRALSAHLVLAGHPSLEDAQAVGSAVRERVTMPLGITHTTFEMECERCDDELDDPCSVDEPVPVHALGTHDGRAWAPHGTDPGRGEAPSNRPA
ncbi:MAG: cation diffusion facilitator family transporter [Actinomycetota bacterium]|jgi:cobalt-zinc-cadmium efflux system protein|nr:cation diffusion facilitator family transporter [Actinomycetota bacterium]MDA8314184.1 cation diffusion facilitator family transporter [Actinomycetota bacterium]